LFFIVGTGMIRKIFITNSC